MAENQVRFNIQTSPDRACGVYSNASIVSSTGDESRIDFLYVDKANRNPETGEVPAHLVSRIIMPTRELSKLSETLTEHINKHLEQGMK